MTLQCCDRGLTTCIFRVDIERTGCYSVFASDVRLRKFIRQRLTLVTFTSLLWKLKKSCRSRARDMFGCVRAVEHRIFRAANARCRSFFSLRVSFSHTSAARMRFHGVNRPETQSTYRNSVETAMGAKKGLCRFGQRPFPTARPTRS